MLDVNEYILLSKEERQKHLKLDKPCIERGDSSKGGKKKKIDNADVM